MQAPRTSADVLALAPAALAALMNRGAGTVEPIGVDPRDDYLTLTVAGARFLLGGSPSSGAGPVANCAERTAVEARKRGLDVIPVVVVPHMTPSGQRACEAVRMSWIDLSGNAALVATSLRVFSSGNTSLFTRVGRPSTVFAPKSARVVRWLLTHSNQAFTQRELSRLTGVNEGLVSRLAGRLLEQGYAQRNASGALQLHKPSLLLDAWRDQYDFTRHSVIAGHVAARSGDALTRTVAEACARLGVEHAATGLSAAWRWTHFAGHRLATFFVGSMPSPELRVLLGFREDARGANLWLVVPNDAGVFAGAEEREGVRCAHPVQVYLDLKGHPERAVEAADQLRSRCLSAGAAPPPILAEAYDLAATTADRK